MNIEAFILARLDEDEATAKTAGGDRWAYDNENTPGRILYTPQAANGEVYRPDSTREVRYDSGRIDHDYAYVTCDREGILPSVDAEEAEHIARQDPASTMRRCEGIRLALAAIDRQHHLLMHASANPLYGAGEAACEQKRGFREANNLWLRGIAAAWADHPDYQSAWVLDKSVPA